MKLVKFRIFESASKILENETPESVSDQILTESGLTREDLVMVNEGILGDIFGGLLKGLKEKILKAVPGSIMKKADAILAEYRSAKMDISDKIMRERNKIYKAKISTDDDDKTHNDEVKMRSEKAIQQIELANRSKLEAIERKLKLLTRDKSDTLNDYVQFQIAQIQEDAANKQLDDAEKYAGEDLLKELEKEVEDAKQAKLLAKKALEEEKAVKAKADEDSANAKKAEDEAKAAKDKEASDAIRNNPDNAKKGQVWKTNNGNEVEIVSTKDNEKGEELADGFILIKGKSGAKITQKRTSLKELVKDVDTELKKVA